MTPEQIDFIFRRMRNDPKINEVALKTVRLLSESYEAMMEVNSACTKILTLSYSDIERIRKIITYSLVVGYLLCEEINKPQTVN